jgi:hypothetical protein
LPPAASSAFLLIQTQLVEWTLTGAAIHLPSYLENAEIADDALLGPVGDVEAQRLHRRRRVA